MSARSTTAPRTLVIGDVHGCLDELRALVAKSGVTADDDVVFVGDLVAKGPDSVGVVNGRASGAPPRCSAITTITCCARAPGMRMRRSTTRRWRRR